jgi:hypothetical protein
MSTYFVNSNTSVIGIKTDALTAGQFALVYLQPTANIGQLITVRDTFGYLSTPQYILISTTGGASIKGGVSELRIEQGYGYVTLRSETSNRWSIVDQNAFSSPTENYSLRGITYGKINVIQTTIIKDFISSIGPIQAINSEIFSTAQTVAPVFANSAVVNSFIRRSDTYHQTGSLLITASTNMLSSLTIQGSVNVAGNKTTSGSYVSQSSASITGNILISTGTGKFLVGNLVSTNYRVYVDSNISTGGILSISSSATVNNMNVSSLRTNAAFETVLQTNEIMFSGNVYIRNRPDIAVVSPTYTGVTTPVIEMQQGLIHSTTNSLTNVSDLNTTYLYARNIGITSSINASGVTQVHLASARFLNSNGSLSISSITAGNLNIINNIYGGNTATVPLVASQIINTSSLFFENSATFLQSTIVNNVITNNSLTNTTVTSSLIYGDSELAVPGLSLSTFFVSTAFIANGMSSFSIPYSVFNNFQGQFYTANANTSTIFTSSLDGVDYISGNNSITISSPLLTVPYIEPNSANTVLPTSTNSIITYGITLGAPYEYSTIYTDAPYTTTSTISGLTSNTQYEFINGMGTPYDPLRIKASVDRTVNIYFQNTTGTSLRYLTMQYTYQNGGSDAGSAGIQMVNNGITSTIFSFNATPISTIRTLSLSNFPIDANTIISTYRYYLTGPTTYSPPSTTTSRNIVVAGGISQTTTVAYSSDGGDIWSPLRFTPLTSSCLGIAWGSDKWVATGEGTANSLMYSHNGSVWYALGKNIFTIRGRSVAYNGSLWVATGEGTNTLAYSKDGINWTGAGSTIFTAGKSVAWNGSLWVATGLGSNTLAYSADGTSWTGIGSTIFTDGTSVGWGSNKWVATGLGSNTLAYSANGTSWTGIGSTILQTGSAVGWSGTEWLAGGGSQIAKSTDGVAWSNTNISTIISSVRGISYSSSNWIVAGTPLTNSLAYSSDGIAWTGRTRSTIFTEGYAVANREFLPRGASIPAVPFVPVFTAGSTMLRTTDGITWSTVTTPFTSTIFCMAWNGSYWVAGGTGTYVLAYSTNGTSWTGVTLPNMTTVYSVAWGLGKWIACGAGSGGYTSASSTDGVNWTEIISTAGGFFSSSANGIAWAENAWVAVGSTLGSGIIFSTDGLNWVVQLNPIFTIGRCVANNGNFWIVGGDYLASTLAYSDDGANWTGLGNSVFTTSVTSVAWGNNIWVAVGSGTNSIAFSYDGIAWNGIGTTIFTSGVSVAWNGTLWAATGLGPNTLAYSYDGVTWIGQGSSVGGNAIVAETILPSSAVNINEPVQIRWDLSGTILMTPSSIQKPLNSLIAWNSRASSLDGYTQNASLTFRIRNINSAFMIGFSENPTITNSFTALNYAFYITTANTLFIYELGSQVASLGPVNIYDNLNIKFTGTQIIYSVNSTAVRTISRGIGNTLYLSSSFRSPGCSVDEIQFQPIFQITESTPVADSYSYQASIRPVRDDIQYTTYSMAAATISELSIGDWQFDIPISGNLSSLSSVLYADFLLNSTKLFSTSYIVSGYRPQASTYTVSFNVSTIVPVVNTDIINLNIRTQRGSGETYFYNAYSTPTSTLTTVVRNNIFNLSSISYLQFYHTSFNSGIQTSELALWINSLSTTTQQYIDSNSQVQMNRGYMVWPNRLYGFSINNRYNDLQTRNLTYTGSLYNASDSNLKYDIEYANTDTIYDKIDKLPLRYYTFNSAYLSTFQPKDRHQLGVITTEVRPHFPEIVNSVESVHTDLSDLNTIDRGQLKFAHLGATQKLIEKISTLSGEIRNLSLKDLR